MLTTEEIRRTVQEVNDYLNTLYKLEKEDPERNWRTYEEIVAKRMKMAVENLHSLVKEATSIIQ
ncbi:MAG: hypothetical protein N3F63_08235, partial [Thermoplasmata archaeon]|nr:hypothetical protein [Thermoplasmata archaeon]